MMKSTRKNKTYFKRKQILSICAKLAMFQIVIVAIFIYFFVECKPIAKNETKEAVIVVDDIEYTHAFFEYRCVIQSGDVEFKFSQNFSNDEYSNREIFEAINKGDKISISYIEKNGLFDNKWVVDAHSETEVYRSLEVRNIRKELLFMIIVVILCFIEMLFLGIIIIYFLVKYDKITIGVRGNKKTKKNTGDGSVC